VTDPENASSVTEQEGNHLESEMGPDHFLFGYPPVSWWRISIAVVIYAMALKIVGQECRTAV